MRAAFALMARDGRRVGSSFQIFRFFRGWAVTYALLFVATLLHETGHAMACLRYGGKVRSIGFVLYLFQPACYTTVTDAWLFPRKLHRIVVSLGGVYIEGFLFAI